MHPRTNPILVASSMVIGGWIVSRAPNHFSADWGQMLARSSQYKGHWEIAMNAAGRTKTAIMFSHYHSRTVVSNGDTLGRRRDRHTNLHRGVHRDRFCRRSHIYTVHDHQGHGRQRSQIWSREW
jgi:hypothetical protein